MTKVVIFRIGSGSTKPKLNEVQLRTDHFLVTTELPRIVTTVTVRGVVAFSRSKLSSRSTTPVTSPLPGHHRRLQLEPILQSATITD